MDKFVGIFDAFFKFLIKLLDTVLKGKVAPYAEDINGIADAVKEAAEAE